VTAVGPGLIVVAAGIVVWLIVDPQIDRLASSHLAGASALSDVLLWAGIAYAISSCCAILAGAILVWQRAGLPAGDDFGRVLVLTTFPTTAAVFALLIGLLLIEVVDGLVQTGRLQPFDSTSTINAIRAFAIGTGAYPIAAWVSGRIRSFSGPGFAKVLMILAAGEMPAVFGLALVLSSLPLASS
jgi:hypothetical protein